MKERALLLAFVGEEMFVKFAPQFQALRHRQFGRAHAQPKFFNAINGEHQANIK